jgi:hypothetical protein
MSQLADSFMAIFGLKRKATVQGNVIKPAVLDDCLTCGETHDGNVPRECETGDGV